MPIYEYKGQLYELSTNDPAEAKRKIQARLGEGTPTLKERAKDLGKAFASAADVALNAVTGTLDVAAYPLARAYYGMSMPPEQAALRAQQETTSPKDIIGRSLGITQQPAYQAEATRRGTQAIGEVVAPVVEALSEQTGAPQQDVASVLGTLSAGVPMAGRAAIKPIQPVVKGFTEGVKRPEYQRTPTTAFAPLESTYVTRPVVERFMAATPEQRVAMLPEVEQGRRGSESLFSSPVDMLARNLAPTDVAGQPLIPYSGMTRQAFGEQLGRDLSNRPLPTTAAGLGGAVVGGLLGGLPGAMIGGAIAPTARLGQMFALERLGKNAGFIQGFPEALAEAQQLAGNQMLRQGPVAPQLPFNPNSVIQAGPPTQAVNIEGQRSNIPTINVNEAQPARPPSGPSIPVPNLAELAQQRSQQVAQQSGNIVQEQAAQRVQGPVRPTTPTPTIAPTPTPTPTLPASRWSPAEAQQVTEAQKAIPSNILTSEQIKDLYAKTNTPPTPYQTAIIQRDLNKEDIIKVFGLTERQAKKAILEAESYSDPAVIEWFKKGEGKTRVTVNKQITFYPNPDIIISKATTYNNGDKDLIGKLASTGEPVSLQLKNDIVTVFDREGKIMEQYDKKGNKILPSSSKVPSNVSQMMLERDPNYERFTIKMPDDIKKGMDTKEATAAMLSGKGEWTANNYKYKMEEVGGGDTRLQVRKDNQVVYERYY